MKFYKQWWFQFLLKLLGAKYGLTVKEVEECLERNGKNGR